MKIYFVYNFLLPVLHYPYLVILERVDLDYTQSKFGKNRPMEFAITKKSNLANAKSYSRLAVWQIFNCLYYTIEQFWP